MTKLHMKHWTAAALMMLGAGQAPAGELSVYGIMHLSVDRQHATIDGHDVEQTNISSNSSRLGFRGSEDLGDGLTALFQIEGKVNADVGSGGLNNRETYVGLRGSLGTVKLGLLEPPIDDLKTIFGNAPTGVTGILNTSALWINGGSNYLRSDSTRNNGFTAMNETLPDAVRYDTPTVAGFRAAAQYSGSSGNRNSGAMVGYADHGTRAAIAVYHNVDADATSTALTAGTTVGSLYGAAVYTHQSAAAAMSTVTRDFWGASLTWSTGTGRLYAFYGHTGDGSLAEPGLHDSGADMAELSYNIDLSRRSTVYLGAVRIDNDANANYMFATNGMANISKGTTVSGVIAGIKHNF